MTEVAAPFPHATRQGIGPGLTFAMAVSTGIGVANIYYSQPMLGVIERAFPESTAAGLIPTATQLGYATGIMLLLPLGDLMDRRRLIVAMFAGVALALVASALAPNVPTLLAASALLGASSSVAQQVVPFAAALAAPEQRGRTLGTVMSGLLCGILLSRTLAGFVAQHFGWRQMFYLAVPLALAASALMAATLPRRYPHASSSYGAALRSVLRLWWEEPELRRASMAQGALFGTFTAFWTILALHLQEPPFHLGATVAGLFGLVGAVGVLAAPVAGRIADRRGPQATILLGASLALASWAVFGFWNAVSGLVVGVVVLDLGVQSALISHQHIIFAIRPEARSRVNTVFVTGLFIGGAIGSAGATLAWRLGNWPAVCVFGALIAAPAIALQLGRR